jgi:hypothetical protein
MPIEVEDKLLPAREGLLAQIEEAWVRLARPGTWWTGDERIAIAAEARQAARCAFCRERKKALSPYGMVKGLHDGLGRLPDDAVEAIHRLVTDASRITEAWVREITSGALGEPQYVELISIVAIITALDTFDDALGRPRRPLPPPCEGEPTRHRPPGAKRNLAWVATLAPEDAAPADPDPYRVHGDKNIHRALSLVPKEVIDFFDLDVELYLKDHEIRDFTQEFRAISHRQIELVAGRVSALNRCYY